MGTNWHTLKLAFHGNRIAVYFDGTQVISVTDTEAQPYLSGGISVDMWTDADGLYHVGGQRDREPVGGGDSYSVNENTTLTVPAPGLLGNDTGVYGTNLAAVVVSGPTNGTLNLNSNGGFSYSADNELRWHGQLCLSGPDGPTSLGTATVTASQ